MIKSIIYFILQLFYNIAANQNDDNEITFLNTEETKQPTKAPKKKKVIDSEIDTFVPDTTHVNRLILELKDIKETISLKLENNEKNDVRELASEYKKKLEMVELELKELIEEKAKVKSYNLELEEQKRLGNTDNYNNYNNFDENSNNENNKHSPYFKRKRSSFISNNEDEVIN